MFLSILATIEILAIAAISNAHYDHSLKTWRRGRTPHDSIAHFERIYRFLQVTTIALALASAWTEHAWLLRVHDQDWLIGLGLVGAAAATWIFIAAKRALGRNYSPCFDAHTPFEIVETGPYRLIRHPLYTANIALLTALFVAFGSLWVLFNTLILLTYYVLSARTEERELSASHPEYREYRARTGMFLPRPGALLQLALPRTAGPLSRLSRHRPRRAKM